MGGGGGIVSKGTHNRLQGSPVSRTRSTATKNRDGGHRVPNRSATAMNRAASASSQGLQSTHSNQIERNAERAVARRGRPRRRGTEPKGESRTLHACVRTSMAEPSALCSVSVSSPRRVACSRNGVCLCSLCLCCVRTALWSARAASGWLYLSKSSGSGWDGSGGARAGDN